MKISIPIICTVAIVVFCHALFAQVVTGSERKSETIRGFITGVSQRKAGDQYVTSFKIQDGKSGEIVIVDLQQKTQPVRDVNVQLYINEYVVVNNLVFTNSAKKQFVLANHMDFQILKQSPERIFTEPE